MIDIDALAQEIRRVDGKHDLGAGQLAEALAPFIRALSLSSRSGEAEADLTERLRGPVFGTPTALDAAATIETWKNRAERLADMHRDMCVVAGTFQSEAERLSTLSLVLRGALEAIDSEVLLTGHLKQLVDEALEKQS